MTGKGRRGAGGERRRQGQARQGASGEDQLKDTLPKERRQQKKKKKSVESTAARVMIKG